MLQEDTDHILYATGRYRSYYARYRKIKIIFCRLQEDADHILHATGRYRSYAARYWNIQIIF
jgi:hypothetical protein